MAVGLGKQIVFEMSLGGKKHTKMIASGLLTAPRKTWCFLACVFLTFDVVCVSCLLVRQRFSCFARISKTHLLHIIPYALEFKGMVPSWAAEFKICTFQFPVLGKHCHFNFYRYLGNSIVFLTWSKYDRMHTAKLSIKPSKIEKIK